MKNGGEKTLDLLKTHLKKDHQTSTPSVYTSTHFKVLTASMPDSCMPMLMTTTLSTCRRTESSSNSFHTDSVSTDDRERCSSCISSISAWMLHLVLYHFRAESQDREQSGYSTSWKHAKRTSETQVTALPLIVVCNAKVL